MLRIESPGTSKKFAEVKAILNCQAGACENALRHRAPLFWSADLVLRMLTKDPAARTKTDQMLKHPWLVRHGVASEKPLPPLVITRMKKFAGLNRLKKVGLRLG